MERMKQGRFLARFYRIDALDAYAHSEGNWYWNLTEFPGVYFDRLRCKVFATEVEYRRCLYLTIGERNTGVRNKELGMSIADIPGYTKLNPPLGSI